MQDPDIQLKAEIEFWRDLIARQGAGIDATARLRMEQALALAERKLLLLGSAKGPCARASGH